MQLHVRCCSFKERWASNYGNPDNPLVQSALNLLVSNRSGFLPMWGFLSLSGNASPVTEPRTGVSFPSVLRDSQRLLGIGLRRKAVPGLKNIDVYGFGVYADVKKFLSETYEEVYALELKGNEKLKESDVGMSIRLQIVYGMHKFGGSDTKRVAPKLMGKRPEASRLYPTI